MKNHKILLFSILLYCNIFAQQEKTVIIPLSDTGRPVQINLDHKRGSITVDGYDGTVVVIQVQERINKAGHSSSGEIDELPVHATEQDNTVRITFSSYRHALDVNIRVPRFCNLEITNQKDGNITVNDVNGEQVIDNSGGSIYLNNVTGTAILSTIDGNIRARFSAMSAGQPMAFSSMDGTIDVMFPKDFGAFLKMKSVYGQIVSDYDLAHSDKEEYSPGTFLSTLDDNWQYARLNEGGAQIFLITYNGDIYLRKQR